MNKLKQGLLLLLLIATTGCFTTKGFIRRSMEKWSEAEEMLATELPRDGNCMVLQMRDTPYPLKLVMRYSATNAPMTKVQAEGVLSQFRTCDELVLFDGILSHNALTGYERFLYPEQYLILKRAEKLQDLGSER